ncbi:MAG: tRNA uridine-5-carboxymethylaminomethyl(34) synthesis GTPase MnmE [Rhizobiales bacterium]|nr:tRNA uridine-5-carboxymethylaminomethyl(34) synthesis GTPase MnmE [Hyphomicrobiales bacterium]NRB15193.1 tRNA uridine-5-carboxymethylaminomethyl(34) synthesis GTPase MnmE [Hyphomicrobiales bacterium]
MEHIPVLNNIYALSSGAGKAGVAVVRLSGPDVPQIMRQIGQDNLTPRYAKLTTIIDPIGQEEVDQCLLLYFAAPHSFTGEHVVEFHLHGSKAVLEHLFKILNETKLCRLAEAGEFSRRAFVNDKLDLTRVEAIAAILDAETLAQKRQALRQLGGSAAQAFGHMRAELLKAISLLEATIDFSEEDIPDDLMDKIYLQIADVEVYIERQLKNFGRSAKLNEGFNVAIIGAPNVGKSSLMNLLVNSDVAIVSDQAGTTRDIIRARLDIDGYMVNLLDSAGIRKTDNLIEAEGVKRAENLIEKADLVLALFDDKVSLRALEQLNLGKAIFIRNKSDLDVDEGLRADIVVSVKTGKNIDRVTQQIGLYLGEYFDHVEDDIVTRERHRLLLSEAQVNIREFLQSRHLPEEITAEYLRRAINIVGKITGHVDVEEILGEIFSGFCIGK